MQARQLRFAANERDGIGERIEQVDIDAGFRGALVAVARRKRELRRQPVGDVARHRLNDDVARPVLDAGGLIHPLTSPYAL